MKFVFMQKEIINKGLWGSVCHDMTWILVVAGFLCFDWSCIKCLAWHLGLFKV
jgi:hypothetical protein